MRAVTSSTAAAVLDVPRKTLDNLVASGRIAGLRVGRQGLERRIPVAVLPVLLLARELAAELSVPLSRAVIMAQQLLTGAAIRGRSWQLEVDAGSIVAEVDSRLESAIETEVRPRRGRPPRHRSDPRNPHP